jgi:hypothetical protein
MHRVHITSNVLFSHSLVQFYIVAAKPANSARVSLFLVPRFIEVETSLEKRFREGNMFEKSLRGNDISYENVSNSSETDIWFGVHPGSDAEGKGSLGYLIADEVTSLHAIDLYSHMNNLLSSFQSAAKSVSGYINFMDSLNENKLKLEGNRQSISYKTMQRVLKQKAYAEGSLALSTYVSALLDRALHESSESSTEFAFLSVILRGWCMEYCSESRSLSGNTSANMECQHDNITCVAEKQLSFDFLKMMQEGNGYSYLQAEINATINMAKSKDRIDVLGEYAEAIEGNHMLP